MIIALVMMNQSFNVLYEIFIANLLQFFFLIFMKAFKKIA